MADAPQDQIAPLLTPEGWELLASLGPYREDEAFRLNASLRKAGHSPELVSAVLTQSRLRTKAEAKFGEFARQMIFTQAGLEQATRLTVAARHAQRFAEAGVGHVADLGCGLGADAMALASLDIAVTAVEMDETTAACATMNLIPFRNATVVHSDATVGVARGDRRRLAGSGPAHHLHLGHQADLGSGGLLPAAVLRGVAGRLRPAPWA